MGKDTFHPGFTPLVIEVGTGQKEMTKMKIHLSEVDFVFGREKGNGIEVKFVTGIAHSQEDIILAQKLRYRVGICNCFDNIPQLYAKIGFRPVGGSFYYESFRAEVQLMHGCMENLTGRSRKLVLPPAAQG